MWYARSGMGDGNRARWWLGMQIGLMNPTSSLTNGSTGRDLASGSVEAGLNEILALGLCDERLQFGSCKCVYEAGFGYNK